MTETLKTETKNRKRSEEGALEFEIENSSEYIAIFKTTVKHKKLLKQEIQKTHPYDVPEIVEIDVTSINKSYLKWLVESTN